MSDDAQSGYEWRETSPGRLERDLDEVEQLYTTMAKLYEGTGHSFFAITDCPEIPLKMDSASDARDVQQRVDCAFQRAWSRL